MSRKSDFLPQQRVDRTRFGALKRSETRGSRRRLFWKYAMLDSEATYQPCSIEPSPGVNFSVDTTACYGILDSD
jgi:hypothetical protein